MNERAVEKSQIELGVVIAALVAVVVFLLLDSISLIHLVEVSHLVRLKTTGS